MHPLLYLYIVMTGHLPSTLPTDLADMPGVLVTQTGVTTSKGQTTQRHAGESAERTSCRKFVEEFYAWYVAHDKKSDPLKLALRRKKANFSETLIQRLKEDYKAAAKSPGEIVGLDFDPVLNSQDFADKYVPGRVTQKGRQFEVEV